MSRTEAFVGIRPEAMRAWLNLSTVLERLEDERRPPVCQADPSAWSSADRTDRAAAATGCILSRCPALDACRRFAVANDERWGIWAGVDVSNPKERRTLQESAA